MKIILVVEDDIVLNNTLTFNLKRNGYFVISAYSAKETLIQIKKTNFDLIILDVALPDGNGFSLFQIIKKKQLPTTAIIFLTANDLEDDVLKGYTLGADDYITKPFSLPIFIKKIEAIINRMARPSSEKTYNDSHLQLDFESLTAYADSYPLEFTPLEFKFLELLIENSGHIVTRQKILDRIWYKRGNYVDESSLNSIVCRIRNKIDTSDYHYIKTVYGTGYMWIGSKVEKNM